MSGGGWSGFAYFGDDQTPTGTRFALDLVAVSAAAAARLSNMCAVCRDWAACPTRVCSGFRRGRWCWRRWWSRAADGAAVACSSCAHTWACREGRRAHQGEQDLRGVFGGGDDRLQVGDRGGVEFDGCLGAVGVDQERGPARVKREAYRAVGIRVCVDRDRSVVVLVGAVGFGASDTGECGDRGGGPGGVGEPLVGEAAAFEHQGEQSRGGCGVSFPVTGSVGRDRASAAGRELVACALFGLAQLAG